MRHYLAKEHINILNNSLRYFPKYESFKLSDISEKIAEIDNGYTGWTYLYSKMTAIHGDIFTDLLLNGFIEIVDKDEGICKFTADGHKLKDFGDYEDYLKYLNLDYDAKRQDNIVKKYWWLWAIISFLAGLLAKGCFF